MIILNAESLGYCAEAEEIVRSLGELRSGNLDRAGLLASVCDIDVLIVRLANRIDAEILDRAPRLRVIVTATTGLDHIDLEAARSRGVIVLSLRGETEFLAHISATAEHTWALLLALVRMLPSAAESVRSGEWDRDKFRGNELQGRCLGIVGLGRLGSQVARYGMAFGMQVIACDPHLRDWPDQVTRIAGIDELLVRSDVLSLHVPLNSETTRMLGAREIGICHKGLLVINTARGELIDESALLSGLASGHVGGAALDVIEAEIAHRDRTRPSPLVEWARLHPRRLIITPHIGGATIESMAKTEVFTAVKLAEFIAAIDRSKSGVQS